MNDIQRVKEAVDIVKVIETYVELKRAGSNFKALCPFHNEKTPSFMVNPNLQIFKCFGCGKGGDVIKFVEEIERLEFSEALKKLAEVAGINLSTVSQTHINKEKEDEKKKIIKANQLAMEFYHHIFLNHKIGKTGREYAQKRNLNKKVILEFKIGYAPDGDNLSKFLTQKGFNTKSLINWGLSTVRRGKIIDKFRNRLIQPIFNINGEIIGFSGRYLGKNPNAPKYLNSPETLVFKKNSQLYSLYHSKEAIRKNKNVIIVEGNLDVISAHKIGHKNVVAPLGTSFTQEQAKIIKRHTDKILMCFDNDNAGIAATIKAMSLFEKFSIEHKVIKLDNYGDPDEAINNNSEYWEKAVKNPVNTLDYILDKLTLDLDLGSPDGKTTLYKRFLPVLKLVRNKIQKEHFIKQLSDIVGLTITDIYSDLENKTPSNTIKIKNTSTPDNLDFQICSLLAQRQIDNKNLLNYVDNSLIKSVCIKILTSNNPNNLNKLENKEQEIFENLLLNDTSKINHKLIIKAFIDSKIKAVSSRPNAMEKIQDLIKIKKQYQ
jgi:DNA primase